MAKRAAGQLRRPVDAATEEEEKRSDGGRSLLHLLPLAMRREVHANAVCHHHRRCVLPTVADTARMTVMDGKFFGFGKSRSCLRVFQFLSPGACTYIFCLPRLLFFRCSGFSYFFLSAQLQQQHQQALSMKHHPSMTAVFRQASKMVEPAIPEPAIRCCGWTTGGERSRRRPPHQCRGGVLVQPLRRLRGTLVPVALLLLLLLVLAVKIFVPQQQQQQHPAQSLFVATDPESNSRASQPSKADRVVGNVAPTHAGDSGSNLRRGLLGAVEFLWEAPRGSNDTHPQPTAVLFVAHGCGHAMTDWWAAAPAVCPECLGLPEERAIVAMALHEFRCVVVALSSVDRRRQGRCWSAARDGPVAASVLQEFAARHYPGLPLLAFGASSGGSFVSTALGPALRARNASHVLSGYISQIAPPPPPSAMADAVSARAVFITMNRDVDTDAAVAAFVKQQQPPSEDQIRHIRLPPLSLTPDFFADRLGRTYANRSAHMVQALHHAGLLSPSSSSAEPSNGSLQLTADPRRSDWRSALAPLLDAADEGDGLMADVSPLAEVLNAAWGMHEMSRDGVREALDFLLTRLG